MHLPKLRFVVLCLLLAGLSACKEAPRNNRKLSPREVGVMYRKQARALHPGMTKDQVAAITDLPHNVDAQYVWCFAVEDGVPQNLTWRQSLFYAGFHLVFDQEGRLLANIHKNAEGTPKEDVTGAYGCLPSDSRVTALLGSEPSP